jgi:hypothetical protein
MRISTARHALSSACLHWHSPFTPDSHSTLRSPSRRARGPPINCGSDSLEGSAGSTRATGRTQT